MREAEEAILKIVLKLVEAWPQTITSEFFFKIYLLMIYEASDPMKDGCEPPCGCQDLNFGRAVSAFKHWAISPAPPANSYYVTCSAHGWLLC